MPRRAVLSDEQRAALLALPDDETLLVQHWTLSRDDLAIIVRRGDRITGWVRDPALRAALSGRFLRPGELIPDTPLAFVAEQLQVGPEVLADYATRGPTRYDSSMHCAMHSASCRSVGRCRRRCRNGSCRSR